LAVNPGRIPQTRIHFETNLQNPSLLLWAKIERVVKFLGNMRFFGRKTQLALLAVLALVAIALLAGGLRQVSFRAGQRIAEREAAVVSSPVTRLVEDLVNIPLWKQLLAWAIIFLIVLIVSTILSPELRRRFIQTFLRFMLTIAALFYLAKNYSGIFRGLGLIGLQPASVPPDSSAGLPPPVFVPPHISPLLFFVVSLVVALVLAAIAWGIHRWWRRRQALLAMRRPIQDLADIARDSLDKLAAGGAWDDVITESYVRMSHAVGTRRGLIRQDAMTPGEFAARLAKGGVPAHAVSTLTHLFERVRYGAHSSTPEEKEQAVTCLTAILDYCGEPA
jgi:hypothetical protein